MSDTDQRLYAIEARNARVELDKAWEVSWTRRAAIALLTYGVVSVYLLITGNSQPFSSALVPPFGYILSTLVLKNIRSLWQSRR